MYSNHHKPIPQPVPKLELTKSEAMLRCIEAILHFVESITNIGSLIQVNCCLRLDELAQGNSLSKGI